MYKRILVPVDGSETSNKALVAALQMARDSGGSVRVVNVVDEMVLMTPYEFSGNLLTILRENATKVLADALEIAKAAGITADQKLIDEPGMRLGEVIAGAAREWEADLVVLGTHGRRGLSRVMLGSGAEQIIRHAPVHVLLIRSDEGKVKTK